MTIRVRVLLLQACSLFSSVEKASGTLESSICCCLFYTLKQYVTHHPPNCTCLIKPLQLVLFCLHVGLVLVLIIYTAVKLRKVKDNFSIKLELKLLSVWAILFAARSLLAVLGNLANVYIAQLFLVITVDFPVLLSFVVVWKQRRKNSKHSAIPTLPEVSENSRVDVYQRRNGCV